MRNLIFSKTGLILVGFLAIAGYFLWAEHEAHIVGYLPLLLVLGLCVGMHFFMHGSHGGHGSHTGDTDIGPSDNNKDDNGRGAP